MKHFDFPTIPPECSNFIIVSPMGKGPPNELIIRTKESIDFLKSQFAYYSEKCNQKHVSDQFPLNNSVNNELQEIPSIDSSQEAIFQSAPITQKQDESKNQYKVAHSCDIPLPISSDLGISSILAEPQAEEEMIINNSSKKLDTKSHSSKHIKNRGKAKSRTFSFSSVPDIPIYALLPERVFLQKMQKSKSKSKTIEYHNICGELSSIISRILYFIQIHYEQGVSVYLDRPKFLEYCSSFFTQKSHSYQELLREETALTTKLRQLPRSRYPNVGLDQVRTELRSLLEYDNSHQNMKHKKDNEIESVEKHKQNSNAKQVTKIKNQNEIELTAKNGEIKTNINDQLNSSEIESQTKNGEMNEIENHSNSTVIEHNTKNGENNEIITNLENHNSIEIDKNEIKIKSQNNEFEMKTKSEDHSLKNKSKRPFYKLKLNYSPYSVFDDILYYFLNNPFNLSISTKICSYPLSVQQIVLEITGIAEINVSPDHQTLEGIAPNYESFNNYLKELVDLILADGIINQIHGIENDEKLKRLLLYKAKAIISISFARIVFDDAYIFNYGFLLDWKRSEDDKSKFKTLDSQFPYNDKDRIILINSRIIQNLYPKDIMLPDGFLIDHSMCRSKSSDKLDMLDNLPDDSHKTIHELMSNDSDFEKMASLLDQLQFYQNPVDISYIIYKIFHRIEKRLIKIHHKNNPEAKRSMSRSKSHDFSPMLVFDDIFLYFLVVFTFSPPLNSRWIAAMLSKYSNVIPKNALQQSSSFFLAVVEYVSTFPSTESFTDEIMDRIAQFRNELLSQM